MAARASVRMDRCYKRGSRYGESAVRCHDPATRRPCLRSTNRRLPTFFLKPNGSDYQIVDRWFGVLNVSRELSADSGGTDPLLKLENDLIAGLRDKDPEQVRNSIEMLGNMKRLHWSEN